MQADDVSEAITSMRFEVVNDLISEHIPEQSMEEQWDIQGLEKALESEFSTVVPVQQWLDQDDSSNEDSIREKILDILVQQYERKCAEVGDNMRIFEKQIIDQLASIKMKTLLVLGMPELDHSYDLNEYVHIKNHIPSNALNAAMQNAGMIISRAGYSTIMDLWVLGKNAILVPTPGQTEQEYLAKKFKDEGIFYSIAQNDFDLGKSLEESKKYTGFDNPILNSAPLNDAINKLAMDLGVQRTIKVGQGINSNQA